MYKHTISREKITKFFQVNSYQPLFVIERSRFNNTSTKNRRNLLLELGNHLYKLHYSSTKLTLGQVTSYKTWQEDILKNLYDLTAKS